MEILSLDTADEFDNFNDEIFKSNENLFEQWTHIGGITLASKSTTRWYWVNSGNRINYQMQFLPGMPDNPSGNEFCLSFGKTQNGLLYNDIDCYAQYEFKFICQQDIIKF